MSVASSGRGSGASVEEGNRPRNIVICLDGTANEFRLRQNTNVVKLFSLLVRDPERQIAYYHPGVGTMAPPGALTRLQKGVTRLLGMAFGYGLFRDLGDAYTFLMNHYRPGDRIFLFGFSRGAYTARALAAMVHTYGLLGPGNDALVPYVTRMMRRGRSGDDARRFFRSADDFKAALADRQPRIAFVGLWDTVSSVGWVERPVSLAFTGSNPSVDASRHAIAIDERRAFFRTNLWRPRAKGPSGPADLSQVWFAGDHCDVGGGHAESESGLSSVALHWMLKEAVKPAIGLLIDPARWRQFVDSDFYCPPDPRADTHESLTWKWRLLEIWPKRHWSWAKEAWERRMNLGRPRTIPKGSLVHSSIKVRGPDYMKRLPPGCRFVD